MSVLIALIVLMALPYIAFKIQDNKLASQKHCGKVHLNEMYPGKWTDEIVTNPLCGQMKKGHTQLADRSLTT